jgi:HTH-type transcriptional regulator/antitoxin HigA
MEALGEMIHVYESRLTPTGDVEPRGVLKYLMEEHQLSQSDLSDIASQGTISDILSGKRGISRALAKKLVTRFHVSSAIFL